MLLSLPARLRIYLACEPTDMRKQFDGLCAIVEHGFHRDPFAGDIYAFFNRRRDRVKLLLWDGNGFMLVAKRLEGGRFEAFKPAGADLSHVELSRTQLMMLLEGIDIKKSKLRVRFARSVRIQCSRGEAQEATGRHPRAR